MLLTPEEITAIANDDSAPRAERIAAQTYLGVRELFKRLPKPAEAAKPAAEPRAAKPKAADIIDTVRLVVSCEPHTGVGRDGRPWGNVLCWKEAGGERDSLKLTSWNADRVREMEGLRRGDEIEVAVREYDKETWEGRTTKTARPAAIKLLHRAPPPPPAPVDSYDDFIGRKSQSAQHVPQYGADGWPTGADDVPF